MSDSSKVASLFQLAVDRLYCGSRSAVASAPILPECLANKVRLNLMYRKRLDCCNAKSLFNESTQVLNLTGFEYDSSFVEGPGIIQVIASQSPNLTILIFHGAVDYIDAFRRLVLYEDYIWISNFQSLEVLDLSQSRAGDVCMRDIGHHCKKLVALNVNYSCVSDLGLEHVIKGLDRLESLFVRNTRVTQEKTLELLKRARNLRYLDSSFPIPSSLPNVVRPISEVVSVIFVSWGQTTLDMKFNLTPNTRVTYNFVGVPTSDHDLLNDVEFLCSTRATAANRVLTFAGISNFLGKYGNSLQNLTLFSIANVNVSVILSRCPKLVHLSLLSNISYSVSSSALHPPVASLFLKTLVFYCDLRLSRLPSCCCSRSYLIQILASPNLEEILFANCDAVTDSVLQAAIACHGLKKIKHMHFTNCRFITTAAFVGTIMSACTSLLTLRLYDCEHFDSLENRAYFAQMVALNRWRVKVSIN